MQIASARVTPIIEHWEDVDFDLDVNRLAHATARSWLKFSNPSPIKLGSHAVAFKEKNMADDLKIRQPEDRKKVNVHQDHELRDWAKSLQVTKQELRDAVDKVGPDVEEIKKYLNR